MNIRVVFYHFVFGYIIYIVPAICVVTSPYSFMLRLSVCVMIYIGIYSQDENVKVKKLCHIWYGYFHFAVFALGGQTAGRLFKWCY